MTIISDFEVSNNGINSTILVLVLPIFLPIFFADMICLIMLISETINHLLIDSITGSESLNT